jgi:NIMA (never in mitosis gene a)-related kinase 1/4/5
VWRDEPYDTKSDVWSLGCVLYEMATLKPPFRAQDMDSLFKKVQKGVYDPLPPKYSRDLADVIGSMLKVKSSHRPSCE